MPFTIHDLHPECVTATLQVSSVEVENVVICLSLMPRAQFSMGAKHFTCGNLPTSATTTTSEAFGIFRPNSSRNFPVGPAHCGVPVKLPLSWHLH